MSLTIKYLDTPEGAQESAVVTGQGLQPFSDSTSMVSGAIDVPWATTETQQWTLDGTRDLLPDAPEGVGWWSAQPSEDGKDGFVLGEAILGETPLGEDRPGGYFAEPPMILIDFSERFTANGITITFSPSTEQWCSEIRVKWYRGNELLAELNGYPDSAQWSGGGMVDSFNRITIELMSTNQPRHFAKIQQIVIGKTIVFGRNEIIKAELINEADHTLGTLSVDTSRFEVLAPDGLDLNPVENQRVVLYRDADMLSTHYIQESTKETAGHYVLSCQSAIGMLEDDFLGGVYENTPVDTVLDDILDGWQYEIDDSFQSSVITGYIPVCSRRNALQQVVFAIGALVVTRGSDKIKLVSLPQGEHVQFEEDDTFPGATLDRAQRVARYELTVHRYKKSNTEETLLDDIEVTDDSNSDESVLVTFDAPHWGYTIVGGEITGSDANWITIKASGAVTVKAKTYTHTTFVRTKKNLDATHTERNNAVSVTDATLVNRANATAVLERLYAAGQFRHTLTQDVVVTDQAAGILVESVGPWGGRICGIITAMDSTLTQNGHTATVTIAGEEVE